MTEIKPTATLWQLFMTFFKIGAFTFGGGYAMIVLVQNQVVDKYHWLTESEMVDMIIIAESTPGIIAVNSATSVGYRTRGIIGGLIATLGVVLPSFLIIVALYMLVDNIQDNRWYMSAFAGIQVCVIVLISNAIVKVFKNMQKEWLDYAILAVTFLVALLTNFNVIFLILGGALVGIIARLVGKTNNPNTILPIDKEGE